VKDDDDNDISKMFDDERWKVRARYVFMTSLAQESGESPHCSINLYMHRLFVTTYQVMCWSVEKKVR